MHFKTVLRVRCICNSMQVLCRNLLLLCILAELRGRFYSHDAVESGAVSEIDPTMIKKMNELQLGDNLGFVPKYFNRADVVMSYATVKGVHYHNY